MSNYQVSCCCPAGGGGDPPVTPFLPPQVHPLNLIIKEDRELASGIIPPTNFKWDETTNRPETTQTGPPVVMSYNANQGLIFLNRAGVYDVELSLTVQNEVGVSSEDRVSLWLIKGANPAAPEELFFSVQGEASGIDQFKTSSGRSVINVQDGEAPVILQTLLIRSDNPPTNDPIYIAGAANAVSTTSLNITWIHDTPQIIEDVRPIAVPL